MTSLAADERDERDPELKAQGEIMDGVALRQVLLASPAHVPDVVDYSSFAPRQSCVVVNGGGGCVGGAP